MKDLLIILIVLLCLSCGGVTESTYLSEEAKYDDLFELYEESPLILSLDSVTGPVTNCIQVTDYDGVEALAYWNHNDRSIVFFDLTTGGSLTKQFISQSGPNAMYGRNFLIHDNDTVFFTDSVQTTYLTNSNSTIKDKYPVEDPNQLRHSPGPFVWTGSPLTYHNGYLYFQGYVGGVFDQPIMAKMDLKTKRIEYFFGYPEFYQNAYWRGGYEYMHYTFNRNSEILVYSFEADHYLHAQSLNDLNSHESYFAGSADFAFLKAPRESMGQSGHELDERKYLMQPSFGRVLYDSYRNCYYRFAFDGLPESDIDSGDPERSTVKPARVIVLDEEFNKVGEKKLDRFRYDTKMSFVSSKGLNIKVKNGDNEDILQFDILKPIRK